MLKVEGSNPSTGTIKHHSSQCSSVGQSRQLSSSIPQGEFDFLVGYDYFEDTCYVWSWADVEHLDKHKSDCGRCKMRALSSEVRAPLL